MQVVVATHGHCFDGLASAVLFTRLFGAVRDAAATFSYRGCGYGAHQPRPESHLDGDENALLDYRYTQDPRLTWYFDHHRTAFPAAGDPESFTIRRAGGQMYHDADYTSCALLIAAIGARVFGFTDPALAPLVSWADRVDSARFASPEQALSRDEPVMRLVSVVEHSGNDALLARLVPLLLTQPLEEVAAGPEIAERYRPLAARHQQFVSSVSAAAERRGRVVLVDLTSSVVSHVEKFVTYALFPDATYSVVVSLRRADVSVTVGYNPWCGAVRDADISAICARYGGGGHPVVGSLSLPRGEVDRARELARAITSELAG